MYRIKIIGENHSRTNTVEGIEAKTIMDSLKHNIWKYHHKRGLQKRLDQLIGKEESTKMILKYGKYMGEFQNRLPQIKKQNPLNLNIKDKLKELKNNKIVEWNISDYYNKDTNLNLLKVIDGYKILIEETDEEKGGFYKVLFEEIDRYNYTIFRKNENTSQEKEAIKLEDKLNQLSRRDEILLNEKCDSIDLLNMFDNNYPKRNNIEKILNESLLNAKESGIDIVDMRDIYVGTSMQDNRLAYEVLKQWQIKILYIENV